MLLLFRFHLIISDGLLFGHKLDQILLREDKNDRCIGQNLPYLTHPPADAVERNKVIDGDAYHEDICVLVLGLSIDT